MAAEETKVVLDIASIGAILATFVDALPHIAALLSVIWGAIRIYETRTVQRWLRGSSYDRRSRDEQ